MDKDWNDLDQNRVTWRALVNAAMTCRFPYHEHFLTAEEHSASPEALCSMQSVSYCGLSQLFLYISRNVGRITKAVCGFHKLIE